jgi:hypothetical protein
VDSVSALQASADVTITVKPQIAVDHEVLPAGSTVTLWIESMSVPRKVNSDCGSWKNHGEAKENRTGSHGDLERDAA